MSDRRMSDTSSSSIGHDIKYPQHPTPKFLNAALWRAPFTREENGKLVLVWLLKNSGLLQEIKTEEQRMIHNWGIALLENMGILGTEENYKRIVDALLALPLPEADRKE